MCLQRTLSTDSEFSPMKHSPTTYIYSLAQSLCHPAHLQTAAFKWGETFHCLRSQIFFNSFILPLPSPLFWLPQLKDWNKTAWRTSAESSHSQKHFEILQLEMEQKNKVLSNIFWFLYYSGRLIPWKILPYFNTVLLHNAFSSFTK